MASTYIRLPVAIVDVDNFPVSVEISNDVGNPVPVSALNLDIRDLDFAFDSVDVSGSEVSLDAATLAALESITVQNPAGAGAVNVQDGGNSLTVDGTVAISNFPATTAVTQSTSPWVVGDGGASLTVDNAGTFAVQAAQSGTWNINDISGTVSLPTGAATLVEQQTQSASLSVLDDWDESDRAKVNPIVGQAGVQGGSGAVSSTTQRVVLATDVALPAGTNGIGKLTSNAGVTIGAVEIAAAQTLATVTTVSTVTAVTSITNAVSTKETPDSSSTFAPDNVTSTALEASHVIKASAGNLFQATIYNDKNQAQYIQFHNTTSLPADTAVPVIVLAVPGKSTFVLDYKKFGRQFSTGIVVCNSSTAATKTIGAADCWFDVQYK